jgi:signal transduction histidine kinase
MSENPESEHVQFARLVSLACHDLRTPLATVYGFARTLARNDSLGDPAARYVQMIESSAQQMTTLLDDLGLAARIEDGRYEPVLQERDTLELARAAAERAGDRVSAAGEPGDRVEVDAEPLERALANLAVAAQRHGGVDHVGIEAAGHELRIAPVNGEAAAVVLADDLRDLGAAIAGRLLAALGGELELDGETLVVRLPG